MPLLAVPTLFVVVAHVLWWRIEPRPVPLLRWYMATAAVAICTTMPGFMMKWQHDHDPNGFTFVQRQALLLAAAMFGECMITLLCGPPIHREVPQACATIVRRRKKRQDSTARVV